MGSSERFRSYKNEKNLILGRRLLYMLLISPIISRRVTQPITHIIRDIVRVNYVCIQK